MALGQLLASADAISFASDYASLPALPEDLGGEARVVIFVHELDAVAELVATDSDTEGLKVPVVASDEEAFPAGAWRVATCPEALYSTTATAVSIRIYDWI